VPDLFNHDAPAIAWDDDERWRGQARDGRRITLEISALSGRVVAIIPLPGSTALVTRRSCKDGTQARAAAEQAVLETAH
jgi:hypothetical protein